jgi:integrase/recombinase XerD
MASVNHMDIRQYLTEQAQAGATPLNSYRQIIVLRQFYDFLNLGGVVSYVAPRFVKLRRPVSPLPPMLTEDQVRRLLGAAITLRERAMIEVFYGTGCRVRELAYLKIENVDFVGRIARVKGKGPKMRAILFTEDAIKALTAYVGNRIRGYVFQEDRTVAKGCLASIGADWVGIWRPYDRRGRAGRKRSQRIGNIDLMSYEIARMKFDKILQNFNLVRPNPNRPLTNVGVRRVLAQVGARVGLKAVTPHMLRRSFATHLSDHGANLDVIQALLGHVYLETTARYVRISPNRATKTFAACHPRGEMHVEKHEINEVESQTRK